MGTVSISSAIRLKICVRLLMFLFWLDLIPECERLFVLIVLLELS